MDHLAQDADAIIPNQPDDAGALMVFVAVGVVLGGVYWLIRRSRRRSEATYWDRREREEHLRRNDPDMAPLPEPDPDPVTPDDGSGSDER